MLRLTAGSIPAGRCVMLGDMKPLRQSIRTRGAFVTPGQKLRALPSYIEILPLPMVLRVIGIAECFLPPVLFCDSCSE